jgi:hypothetical protein
MICNWLALYIWIQENDLEGRLREALNAECQVYPALCLNPCHN